MKKPGEKLFVGYCSSCAHNIQHFRQIDSTLFRCLDFLTLRLAKLFRMGPWYCSLCHQKSMWLAQAHANAPTISVSVRNPSMAIPVGNYIRTDRSLVMKQKRQSRFSAKYRDGMIGRLLNGTSTFGQIRQQLGVTEGELLDWVADLLARKQDRIDELTALLDSLREQPSFYEQLQQLRSGQIIDGLKQPEGISEKSAPTGL